MTVSPLAENPARVPYTDKAADLLDRRKVSQQDRQSFLEILEKTGPVTPETARQTLSSLSEQEREVLRVIHGMADRIPIQTLNDEGAYNLLRQPGSEMDLNDDGFLQIGAALIYRFPPPNAPEEVQRAWDEMMAGKSESEKMLSQMFFAPLEISANVKYDSQGNAVGIYSPYESGYTNIYARPGFTYTGLVEKYLTYLENVKYAMNGSDYQERKQFALDFKAALERNQAA